MKIEQAKEIAEKAIGQLAESLERGQSAELTKYLATMAKFPRYSFHNLFLILAQRPAASRVAGYHTWLQLGRQVNRGAKGILIFAPIVRRKEIQQSDAASADNSSAVPVVGFRGVHVFSEEDTCGQPLPHPSRCQGDPSAFTERLKAFALSNGIQLLYTDEIRPAQGRCSKGKIELLPGMEPAVEFSVLSHELGHYLLHFSERRAETTKRIRETEAEAVAFVVCQAIGLDAISSASDYISLYSGDKDALSESLHHIQRASSDIIAAITAPD
jgi:N-terminal domain of anti-restriction factor ArdC